MGRCRRVRLRLALLLELLETQEISHFALRLAREPLVLLDELVRLGGLRVLGLAEELAHLQLENLENLEQSVETDLVLALLHAGEIRLRDADPVRKLRLRQAPALAELANAGADEGTLAG